MKTPTTKTITRFGFTRVCLVSLAATFLAASHLPAVIISGVTATTDMGSGFGTSLTNTLNGSGLSSFPSLTATHVGTDPGNSWVSSGTLGGNVTFSLGGSFTIGSFSFWNQNNGGPGASGSTGIQAVNVLFSTDGIAFAALPGAPTIFGQKTGINELPEIFTFAPVQATDIRFAISSNYGDNGQTGFAEVAFDGVPGVDIPFGVDSTLGLAVLGALGALRLRRRRSA